LKKSVSVIIPTFSHAGRDQALTRLVKDVREKGGDNLDIIVVDNGCSLSNTAFEEVSRVQVVKVPVIGLSRARNAGIKHAKKDILIFVDDDVVLEDNFFEKLLSVYEEKRDVLCVGCQVKLDQESRDLLASKKWLSSYFLRFILPPVYPAVLSSIKPPFYIIGACMSFRKDAFTLYGYFNNLLGRRGTKLLSGEDTDFVARIPSSQVYIQPHAIVATKLENKRAKRLFFVRRIYWQAVTDALLARVNGIDSLYDRGELTAFREVLKHSLLAAMRLHFTEAFCRMLRFTVFALRFTKKTPEYA